MLLHTLQKEKKKESASVYKPRIFSYRNAADRKTINALISRKTIQHVVDEYEEQLRELFAIQHPKLVYTESFTEKCTAYIQSLSHEFGLENLGNWVFYPWNDTITHVLPEKDFFTVRTARNKNLITESEQKKFYKASVGIAGLSVGNSIALTLAIQGGAQHIKLADHDTLALSNTNRIRSGVTQLGVSKVILSARQIFEINPYAHVDIFTDGLHEQNIDTFFKDIDIIIDEIDSIAMKFLIRSYAKRLKIPLVTAADSADGGVVDVERYDTNPKQKFFHGRLGAVTYEKLNNLNKFEVGKTITQWVGPENITPRMQESLLAMGKTIVSWPQLGGAALLNGSLVAYCVRKIANDQPILNSRAVISMDEILDPSYNSPVAKKSRKKTTESFKKLYTI